MKLVFAISSLGKGGAEKNFFNLIKYFRESFQVSIITLDNKGKYYYDLCELVGERNIYYLSKRKFGYLSIILKIRGVLKQVKPDRIISFLFTMNYLMGISALGTDFKLILSERNNHRVHLENRKNTILIKALLKIAYLRCDKIIAVSEKIKENISKDFLIKPNKIIVIYNGLEFEEYIDIQRNMRLVTAARLVPQKNYPMLLKALAFLKNSHQISIFCDILGDGGLMDDLKFLANKLGVLDQIVFHGEVSNVQQFLIKNYAFILTSNYEGFPNSLLEAAYYNGLLISTDCETGPNEIISDNVNGYLIPVNDYINLANKIKFIYEMSPETVSRIRNLSKENSLKFSIQSMLNKFENVIKE
ncbi:glycosyltransferase [Cecembia lonarensis]|uniref:UDP-D-galactose:(Glucosyl)lipopolysaccharide-1, 6-D-galactosyltransferase n=1 Tax=Cecembia lonarensis (strain CCUG 58316 / KCTC 22772 / LW9) TaxID=1225176 RepID=K1L0P0_CECL9|nr:glycosyltransferase [Cecembia lonarensis]EKB48331.1 UDP-D-galactose:(glucosyl)lipopolysaccharide-1,6-D-galactosyltransferase [Cecembia lonarensis LW9]